MKERDRRKRKRRTDEYNDREREKRASSEMLVFKTTKKGDSTFLNSCMCVALR